MKKLLTTLFIVVAALTVQAQLELTQYNMRLIQPAGFSNASFTPSCNVTVGGILFGNTSFGLYNTGISRNTFYSLIEGGDRLERALNSMEDVNEMSLNFRKDIIHFGFRVKENHYFGLNASVRSNTNVFFPRDLFTLIFVGNAAAPGDEGISVPEQYQLLGKRASLDGTGVDHSTFAEIGLQYAVKLMDEQQLELGVRPKMLVGLANIQTVSSQVGLTTDATTFNMTLDGGYSVNTSISVDDSGNFVNPGMSNLGFGVDLGATFRATEKIEFSAALNDLGYINWKTIARNYNAVDGRFDYYGFQLDGSILDVNASIDSIVNGFGNRVGDSLLRQFGPDTLDLASYRTNLPTNLNLAGNYHFTDRHSLGAVFNLRKPNDKVRSAFSLQYTYSADEKYSFHANYSIYNRSFVNLGLGASVRLGPIQVFAMTDNIIGTANFLFPFYFLPWGTKNRHVQAGLNWKFGCRQDKDKDGIKDKDDACPDTPGELKFQGCPDTDKDGVMDREDLCPETPGPKELGGCPDRDGDGIIDKNDECPDAPGPLDFDGCPDTDNDGIQDKEDLCPTVKGIAKFSGCPDTDEDGIQDSEDECPEDPGILAFKGCPDTDGDGIKDSEDECPEKAGPKEKNGCPDTDGDGLTDNKDNCPEIAGPVDNQGCPYGDRDGDGVFDNEDSCPDTPGPAENAGCPYSDLDGDGVFDKDDRCPQTPGVVENAGCPEIKKEEQEVLKTAFDNLEFETGKAVIRNISYESLDNLADLLVKNESWKLQISGHTDNVGSEASNLKISENRSKAVASYLESKGVPMDRMIVKWFGESQPIDDNSTAEGRARNRRVEMEVVFD